MIKLILARHGRTDFNAAGRFQGWLDTNLDELGRAQAAKLGSFLAGELKGANLKIFSSPLKRAKDTMQAFIDAANYQGEYAELNELKEINHGDWNGLLASSVDQDLLAKWKNAPHTTPAGPNAETLASLQKRAIEGLLKVILSCNDNDVALVFSHDAVIRVILLAILDAPLASFNALQQHNCSLNVINLLAASNLKDAKATLVHANLSAHTGVKLLDEFHQAAL